MSARRRPARFWTSCARRPVTSPAQLSPVTCPHSWLCSIGLSLATLDLRNELVAHTSAGPTGYDVHSRHLRPDRGGMIGWGAVPHPTRVSSDHICSPFVSQARRTQISTEAGNRAGVRESPVSGLRRFYFYGRFGTLHRLVTDSHDSASVMDLVCRLVSTVFERTTQGTGHGSPCRFCYVIVESARSSVSGESTRGNCSVCRGRCVGITCSPVHRFTGSLKHSV